MLYMVTRAGTAATRLALGTSPAMAAKGLHGRMMAYYGTAKARRCDIIIACNRSHHFCRTLWKRVRFLASGISRWNDHVCGQVPIVSGGNSKAAAKWESRTVYQPNLAILNNTVYDFYVRSLATAFPVGFEF